MSVIRSEFHTRLATRALDDILYDRSRFFYYLGKIDPWNAYDTPPVSILNSVEQDVTIRNNMAYMRKVAKNDISLVTVNNLWTSGNVYHQWDHTMEMYGLPFYCITDEFNVYKCLNNNNNGPSNVQPRGTGATEVGYDPIKTADDYTWKYMYNVSPIKRKKFLSVTHLPVQKALTDSFYNKGAVDSVVVLDSGANYTSATITVEGDGTGSNGTGTATFVPVINNGKITSVSVTDVGVGYTYIKLTVTSSTGYGAKIAGIIKASDLESDQASIEQAAQKDIGAIYAIKVTTHGSDYTAIAEVHITGDGIGAEAVPRIGPGGTIERIDMTSYGSGYTWAQVSMVDPNRVNTGGLVDCEAYAILPPVNGHGYDAIKELYGDTIAIYTQIVDDEELNLINQEYRQYGLVADPVDITSMRPILTDINFLTFSIELTNVDSLKADDILINNNKRYRIVNIVSNVVRLQQLSSFYVAPTGAFTLKGTTNQYPIKQIISLPTVNKYTGELLYTSSTMPFKPTTDTSTVIRTYLKL